MPVLCNKGDVTQFFPNATTCPIGWEPTLKTKPNDAPSTTTGNQPVVPTSEGKAEGTGPALVLTYTDPKTGKPVTQTVGANYVADTWLVDLKANNRPAYDGLVSTLRAKGAIGPKTKSSTTIQEEVRALANEAAARYASSLTGGPSTGLDFMSYLNEQPNDASASAGSQKATGQITTSITSPENAQASLDAAAIKLIGRRLAPNELAKYEKELNAMEVANPTVSKYGTQGTVATTTTESGMDKGEMLKQILAKNPDFADFQIDNTVADWFVNNATEGQKIIHG